MAQAAAEKIQGVLGSFGASIMGAGGQPETTPNKQTTNLNFSDDEDDWAKMRSEVINKAAPQ